MVADLGEKNERGGEQLVKVEKELGDEFDARCGRVAILGDI